MESLTIPENKNTKTEGWTVRGISYRDGEHKERDVWLTPSPYGDPAAWNPFPPEKGFTDMSLQEVITLAKNCNYPPKENVDNRRLRPIKITVEESYSRETQEFLLNGRIKE